MNDAPQSYFDSKYAWRMLPRREPPPGGVYDEATAREQAARCIQCPNPVCVTACPRCSRIPEWLALTAEGRFLEAAAVLRSTGDLSEACASACPAGLLCEGMCIINGKAEAVSIRAIGRFLEDFSASHGGA